ncbi:MAG: glycosyltransferase family 1 protein [Nocardioides sp.]|nr:glycosyltransferase family 1 protein [Nocardioides sp.]
MTVTRSRPLQVVAVPASHTYVRQMTPGPEDVVVRPDPDPEHPDRAATGRWWPPVALRPGWAAQQDLDLMHLHFGFDAASPDELGALVDSLHRSGRPLVLTVHDLRSPHQQDGSVLEGQLDVLVPRADAVLTLTSRAAAQIQRRWGRPAVVVAHPHLVPLARMTQLRDARRRTRGAGRHDVVVGVSCKSLRTNTDPLRLLPVLEQSVRRVGARLRVDLHRDVVTHADADPARRALVDHLTGACRRGVEVVVHEPFDDEALWTHLGGLDVAVLPYRFGTHSGWLEACHDVGTRVLAPSFGCYADQGADGLYTADEHCVDAASLADAVARLVREARLGTLAGADAPTRARQREQAVARQLAVYREVLDTRRSTSPGQAPR